MQILDAPFEFGPINRGALVQTRILNGDGGRNCEQLGAPQVFVRKTVRHGATHGEQAKSLVGRYKRNAEPGTQMVMVFESLPIGFLPGV